MNHYILVIHGTFSSPEKGEPPKWFQSDPSNPNNFCHRLNEALALSPLHNAVWRQCPDDTEVEVAFDWNGKNSHEDREAGAKKLCKLLLKMRKADPQAQIHMIAHSHGGNVVLKAIELYFTSLEREAHEIYLKGMKMRSDKSPDNALDKALKMVWIEDKINDVKDDINKIKEFKELEKELKEVSDNENWSSKAHGNLSTDVILPLFEKIAKKRQGSNLFYHSLFKETWSRSPDSHRLGKIVFMGTPFYSKAWSPVGTLNRIIDFPLAIIAFGVIWYALGLGILALRALNPFDSAFSFEDLFGSLNLLNWPVWYQVLFGVITAFGAFNTVSKQEHEDVNIYYQKTHSRVQDAPPLHTLVLSAGLLDEALIALSIRPLLDAYISPILKKMLTPDPFQSFPSLRSGETGHEELTLIKRIINWAIMAPVKAGLFGLLWAMKPWMNRFLKNMMLNVASSKGFGLPINEFSGADIKSAKDLKIPKVFATGDTCDVTELLAMKKPPEPPIETSNRFDFLWREDSALNERLKKSPTWEEVIKHVEDGPSKSDVKTMCAIIDARRSEFELFHSMYYEDENIIQAIATFLKTGDRPEGNRIKPA